MEEPDLALIINAKFQKDHGCERCVDRKESGIAEMQCDHGEIPDLAGQYSRESAIAVGKEFGMAEDNFVMKSVRSEVKKFATEM